MRARPVVAIAGSTGAVGVEMIASLEQRNFPLSALKLLASPRSAGTRQKFRGQDLTVEALTPESFAGVDIALFSAGSGVSKDFAPHAVKAGAVVVDNSSAFRMSEGVPLVVPEINPEAIASHAGIIANPNCTAIIACVPLFALHRANKITRVIAATYQAASGAGAAAMQELEEATRAYLDGRDYAPKVLPHPYAFNVFSHNAKVDLETGYNDEELKVHAEAKKIMGLPDLRISATCIRVPVLRAHCEALSVEFERPMPPDEARAVLSKAPGVRIVDDRERNYFPMPKDASGQGDVLVGRLRTDVSDPTGKSLSLFVAGDQLLKGAALNAVQIAELLLPGRG
jgi:aspartate-semialdehyde dehydrogenase